MFLGEPDLDSGPVDGDFANLATLCQHAPQNQSVPVRGHAGLLDTLRTDRPHAAWQWPGK